MLKVVGIMPLRLFHVKSTLVRFGNKKIAAGTYSSYNQIYF